DHLPARKGRPPRGRRPAALARGALPDPHALREALRARREASPTPAPPASGGRPSTHHGRRRRAGPIAVTHRTHAAPRWSRRARAATPVAAPWPRARACDPVNAYTVIVLAALLLQHGLG